MRTTGAGTLLSDGIRRQEAFSPDRPPSHISEEVWRGMAERRVVQVMPTQTAHKDSLNKLSQLRPSVGVRSFMAGGGDAVKEINRDASHCPRSKTKVWAVLAVSMRMPLLRYVTGQTPALRDHERNTDRSRERSDWDPDMALASVSISDEAQTRKD